MPAVDARISATYSDWNRFRSSRSTEARMITAATPANKKLKNSEKSSTTSSPSNASPFSSAAMSITDQATDAATPNSPSAIGMNLRAPRLSGNVTSPTMINPAAISSASSGPKRLISSISYSSPCSVFPVPCS